MGSSSYPLESPIRSHESAYRQTELVIREHSKTFFFATALLPTRERRAIRALYAFCRASDDLVDRSTTTPQQFEAWRTKVSREACQQNDPILISWAHVRE